MTIYCRVIQLYCRVEFHPRVRADVNKLENRFDGRPFTTLKIEQSCFKLFFLEKFLKRVVGINTPAETSL